MARAGREALARRAVGLALAPAAGIAAAVDALGLVQFDPIRAPARAQDLILRHRVAGYRAGDLDRGYPDLPLAEDYIHVYGVIPDRVRRLLHPRAVPQAWQVERAHPRLARRILDHVDRHGPVHPRELRAALPGARVASGWGGSTAATTRMLEALHHRGVLRVARRDDGIKVYERSRPSGRPLAPDTRARGLLMLLVGLYGPLPLPSLRTLARMVTETSLPAEVRERALVRLLASEALDRTVVDGIDYVWTRGASVAAGPDDDVRLLAPFDPLVWDRRRFAHLWGWEYRFEAYTPPAKRVFGYYALPLLWRDAVVGWANVAVRDGTLDATTGYAAGRPPRGAAFRRAFDAELARLAVALGVAVPGSAAR
jgi:uncharacterized protein YcaQ